MFRDKSGARKHMTVDVFLLFSDKNLASLLSYLPIKYIIQQFLMQAYCPSVCQILSAKDFGNSTQLSSSC